MVQKLLKSLLVLMFMGLYNFSNGQQFTVYDSWNFESETLGAYDSAAIVQDFNVYGSVWHDDQSSIVLDTINNSQTKVLKINNPADELWSGLQMYVQFDVYDELYMSYNIKFDKDWSSTAGGKLPGLRGLPTFGGDCPVSGEGFYLCPMFKKRGEIHSYHYDRTPAINRIGGNGYPDHSGCPWSIENYLYDTIYFSNGTWYNFTQRLVNNTFTGTTPNTDGINEIWVNGKMIFRESELVLTEDTAMGIDGMFIGTYYGGSDASYMPVTDSYLYLDNISLYVPANDSVSGNNNHHPSTVLPTPDEITNRDFYYDTLITSEGTLSNLEYYGYSSCAEDDILIDAGEGNTVSYNITSGALGGGDFLFFYDGKTTDANIIEIVEGYNTSFTGTRQSSGRYMFVRFSADNDMGYIGWTGTVSFSGDTLPPAQPTGLHATDSTNTSISIAWTDASSNESKFIIERSFQSGSGYSVIDSVNANITTYTDTGLASGTTYYYKIKARNSNGDSNYSNVCQGTTQDTSSITNVALGKTATQSSTVLDCYASFAVDGDTEGDIFSNSVTHTDSTANAWWQVDLGQVYSISSIEVWNRTDCCMDRLDNYYVMLADTFTSTDLSTALAQSTWSEQKTTYPDTTHYFSPSASGRYVRVQLGDAEVLSLAEVIVWGSDSIVNTTPVAPSGLEETDSTATTITIGWTDNATNEDKFMIERSFSSGSGFAVIDSVDANMITYTNTGLSSNTTYYYKVKAKNSYGESSYSNTLEAHTDTVNITNVALGKTATQSSSLWDCYASLAVDGNKDGDIYGNSVTHTDSEANAWWQVDLGQVYSISSIEVWNRTDCCMDRLDNYYVMLADTFTSTDLSTALAQSTWYEQKTTYPDSTHYLSPAASGRYVRVQLGDTNFLSLAEVIVWGSDTVVNTTPVAPSSLEETDSTATSITIGWTDNASNEDKFIIERSFLSGSGFAVIDSVSANVTSYTNTGLNTDTTYYYKIKAKNSYGESSYSNTLEAHTADVTSTNISQGKTASQSSTAASGTADKAVDGDTDGTWSNGSVTHTDDETNAWWQVDLGDDYQVTSIEIWNRTDCCMDRLDNYYVMLADTFTSNSLSTALSESTWYEHKTTYPNTTHYFYPDTTGHYVRVQLGDTNPLSLAEVIVWGYDADLKKAGSFEEIKPGLEPEKPINVYPNPGSTMITISGFEQAVEIKMVDMLGKVVYLEGKVNNSTQIDVSNLKKGLYLILVKKENNIHVTKFIKN